MNILERANKILNQKLEDSKTFSSFKDADISDLEVLSITESLQIEIDNIKKVLAAIALLVETNRE